MPINVIRGAPGTRWDNDTGKVAYQFIVNRKNTCGLCYQFDHAISTSSWPIPLHFGCRCVQRLVYPNATAQAFVDFRKTIRDLDPSQRNRVVGAGNLRLIEANVVRWEDVVTESRIRDLTEVVSLKRLTVKQMVDVGIPKGRAQALYDAAQSGPQTAADESRRRILAALEQRGVDANRVRREVAERIARRVRTETPGGGGTPPAPAPNPAQPAPRAPTIASIPKPPPIMPPVGVTFKLQGNAANYQRAWRDMLGRVPTESEVAALAGAVDGAEVVAKAREYYDVVVTWTTAKATATRLIYRDDNGKLVLWASYFAVDKDARGKGLGRESFGRMVETAQALNFDRIETSAARAEDQIGYKVWPLFGYDGEIPEHLLRRLPDGLKDARRLSDLMATEEGRTWWEANGGTTNLTFDLKPGSPSLQVWEAYRAAKARIQERGGAKGTGTDPTSRGPTSR